MFFENPNNNKLLEFLNDVYEQCVTPKQLFQEQSHLSTNADFTVAVQMEASFQLTSHSLYSIAPPKAMRPCALRAELHTADRGYGRKWLAEISGVRPYPLLPMAKEREGQSKKMEGR